MQPGECTPITGCGSLNFVFITNGILLPLVVYKIKIYFVE